LTYCQDNCGGCYVPDGSPLDRIVQKRLILEEPKAKIAIYPNPATDYIQINNVKNLKEVHIFNVVGNEVKTFNSAKAGQKLNISNISSGMYLVQLIDSNNKIIATKRLSKR